MKNALTVVRYTILRNWRDSSSITEQILLLLGLIFVLGSALGGIFEGRDVGPTPVAYVIEATTPQAASVRHFLTRDDVSRYLETVEATALEDAYRMLEAQDVYTVIHVPPAFASEMLDLTLIELTGRAPGAFDFYAVSMLVLTIMFVAGYAVDGMREDLLDPIGRRVRTTAISSWAHIAGKLAANTVTGLIQAVVIIAVTFLVFGVNWGARPLMLAGLVASIVIFAVALGALVLGIVRDGQKAQSIVSFVVLGSMIVSGGAVIAFTLTVILARRSV